MKRHTLIIIAMALLWSVLFFRFTADDAGIVARSAENLIRVGMLTTNPGEAINALTSPLHALLAAALFALTGHTLLAWKLMGLLLTAAAAWVVTRHTHNHAAALTLMLGFPPVILWAVGGLETPLLLLLVTTQTALALYHDSPRGVAGVMLCGALATLTRYDAALYAVPLALWVLWRTPHKRAALMAATLAALLPLGWLALAYATYGDLLPHSFYYKVRAQGPRYYLASAIYGGLFLLLSGTLPLLLTQATALHAHLRERGWVYAALIPMGVYALQAALTHMMFSFRLFVPLLGVMALLVAEVWDQRRPTALTVMLVVHLVHGGILYTHSINGVWVVGEYAETSVREYAAFTNALEATAADLAAYEPGRVFTRMGGMLPYRLPEWYIYTGLVSYRHHCAVNILQSADYAQLLIPQHGSAQQQLGARYPTAELLTERTFNFEGQPSRIAIYRLPAPQPHTLSPRVDVPCP